MGRGLGLEVRKRKIECREVECYGITGISIIHVVVRDSYIAV